MANEFKVRKSLVVNGSGSVLLDVQGSQGQLFSITDSLSGSLFAVKDISGMPIMEAFSDNTVRMGQFGQKVLFVSQSKVGIGKETALNANLDISGSATLTGSLIVSGSSSFTGSLIVGFSGSQEFRVLQTGVSLGNIITDAHTITGSLAISGSVTSTGFTGSLLGTASYASQALTASNANTASYVLNAVSASFSSTALTASYATQALTASNANTASYVLNAVSASFATQAITASNANTASYVLNAVSASFASTASTADNFTVRGTLTAQTIIAQTITSSTDFVTGSTKFGSLITNTHQFTGSVSVSGSITSPSITGSLLGTASFANRATTSSYALTASYAQNIVISGSINDVDYIDFNTGSAVPAWKSGRVFWDNTEGCLGVYNAEADVTLQVGQENWTRVFNDTTASILNGSPVRIIGTHGDHPEVVLATALPVSGAANLVNQILGVATHTIEASTFGYITTQGLVRGLNTSAYNDGDTIYVSTTPGQYTNIVLPAPYEVIPIGQVVKAGPGGSGIIYVSVQQPLDFADLSTVERGGIYDAGDLWTFVPSGSFGVWRHTNQLSGSYGLTGSLNATSFTGSLLGTASYARQALTASYATFADSVGGLSSGSFATTGSNTFLGNQTISGSLNVTQGVTSSLLGTASWAVYAITASYATSIAGITSGSIITTGSNTFIGDQTISGSLLLTGNLNVLGTASFVYVTASQLALSASFISVNVFEPAERFGGLKVYDSGSLSHLATASLAWDSLRNVWVYQNASGSSITGGVLIAGPENTGSLGSEAFLTDGRIVKSVGDNHIDNSIMSEVSGSIGVSGSFGITGSLLISQSLLRNQNILITAAGTNALTNDLTGSYTAAFYNYTLASASNARAGQFTAVWSGNNIQYMDNSTVDIGNTSGAVLNATLSNGFIVVSGVFATGNWNFKSTINLI